MIFSFYMKIMYLVLPFRFLKAIMFDLKKRYIAP